MMTEFVFFSGQLAIGKHILAQLKHNNLKLLKLKLNMNKHEITNTSFTNIMLISAYTSTFLTFQIA